MGVYIDGMGMPKSCYYCPMTNDGFYLCKATSPFKELEDDCEECKPQWCPLVPVPPHGRLIDASEKIRVQFYDDMTEDYHIVEMTIDDLLSQGWVEATAPTIIPAEEGEA